VRILEKKLIKSGLGGYSRSVVLPKGWLSLNEVNEKVYLLTSGRASRLLIVLPRQMSREEIMMELKALTENMKG